MKHQLTEEQILLLGAFFVPIGWLLSYFRSRIFETLWICTIRGTEYCNIRFRIHDSRSSPETHDYEAV